MDILIFNSSVHTEEFLEWLGEVDRFFDYMDIDDDQQVRLVVLRFKGLTDAWWEQTIVNRRKAHQRPVQTWKKLKNYLNRSFCQLTMKESYLLNIISVVRATEVSVSMLEISTDCHLEII